MSDLISRQEVKELLRTEWVRLFPMELDPYLSIVLEKIENIPSTEPEIIHCGECAFAEVADPEDVQDGYRCRFHPGWIWFSGSFCSWAKAKAEVRE